MKNNRSTAYYTLWEYQRSEQDFDHTHAPYINRIGTKKTLCLDDGRLKTGSFVGVVGWPGVQIQILPKLYRTTENREDIASRNLLDMLQYTGNFSRRLLHTDAALKKQRTHLFDGFVYLFAVNVLELIKHDMVRHYEPVEDEQTFLRGKWLLEKQLAHSPHRRHIFSIRYDELTQNTPLHQLLKSAARFLLIITSNDENKRLLRNILFLYADVDDLQGNSRVKVNFSRLNEHYRPVYDLALHFLGNQAMELTHGTVAPFGLLFDMNKLFEDYIATLIIREQILENTTYAGCEIGVQNRKGWLVRDQENRGKFALKPDIILFDKKTKRERCIIDTKYKLLNRELRNVGISQADMYQMYAYVHSYNCNRVIVLYPSCETIEEGYKKVYTTNDTVNGIRCHKRIEIHTIDIRRDLFIPKERQYLREQLQQIINGD